MICEFDGRIGRLVTRGRSEPHSGLPLQSFLNPIDVIFSKIVILVEDYDTRCRVRLQDIGGVGLASVCRSRTKGIVQGK